MTAKMAEDPNSANGQGNLESEVNNTIASRGDIRHLLSIKDRWLNTDELREVYRGVFPRITDPTRWDRRLQRRELMPQTAVAEELGQDMQEIYDFLVREINFLNCGTRPHNSYEDLSRHLWDTAYRGNVMGLPLETRQMLLMHSIPEYKARGLEEARKIVSCLSKEFENYVGDSISARLFWDGILLDHLAHTMKRIGGKTPKNGEYLHRRLSNISKVAERTGVSKTLGDIAKMPPNSSKRLVPVEIVEGDYLFPEARARLHQTHVESMYNASREALEMRYDSGRTYSNPVLLVEALCYIDKLRTADSRTQVERVTREAMDFLPYLDRMVGLLHNSGLVNNPLAFVNAALKAELLTELDQRTAEAKARRDTTFAGFADLLVGRLTAARKLYGSAAEQTGYKQAYVSPRMR